MLHRVFVVTTVLVFASLSAFAGDLSTDEISALQEKAKKDAAGMVLPPNDYEALGRQKAEEAYRIYQSEEFQRKIALERERIQKEVFGREGYYKDSKKGSSTGGLGANERIYVFLSSSIPTGDPSPLHERGGRPGRPQREVRHAGVHRRGKVHKADPALRQGPASRRPGLRPL